jgi:hypothetical protein
MLKLKSLWKKNKSCTEKSSLNGSRNGSNSSSCGSGECYVDINDDNKNKCKEKCNKPYHFEGNK